MNLQKEKDFLIRFSYIFIILCLFYISIKYALPLLSPFVVGGVVAVLVRPIVDRIGRYIPGKQALISIIILLVFYGIIGLLIGFLGVKLTVSIQNLISKLPGFYLETLQPKLVLLIESLSERFPEIETYLINVITNISDSIFSFVTSTSGRALGFAGKTLGHVPSLFIRLLFAIIFSFFLTIDYHKVKGFVKRQIPKDKLHLLSRLKKEGIMVVGKLIKSYSIIMSITFVELSIGLSILKISNPFLIALAISVFDILPILGAGGVLLPWAIFSLILGNVPLGIGLFILYGVIMVVRQVIEPKIVGQQIGLHPIATLLCMFIGAKLLGVIGLFLFPITATIIKGMNDEGVIHLFK